MHKLLKATLLLVSALVTIPVLANAATWPDEFTAWTPIEGVRSNPVVDPFGDVAGPDFCDVVGSGGDAAGYYYEDGSTLYLRVRLAASPQRDATSWESFSLWIPMDTDGDTSPGTYDALIRFSGVSGSVDLGLNSLYSSTSWCDDQVDSVLFSHPAPGDFSGNARVVLAGTTFGLAGDVFLDIQIPFSEFSDATGLTEFGSVALVVLGTSTLPGYINRDTADLECGEIWGSMPIAVESGRWGDLKATYR